MCLEEKAKVWDVGQEKAGEAWKDTSEIVVSALRGEPLGILHRRVTKLALGNIVRLPCSTVL